MAMLYLPTPIACILIFSGDQGNILKKKERKLHLEVKNDPDYLGYITFEQPGKLFSYTADGICEISSDEVEEVIEIINHYRDTPRLRIID